MVIIGGGKHGLWVEETVTDDRGRRWRLAARVFVVRGHVTVAEVRVVPHEPGERPPAAGGTWSGNPSRIPKGGIVHQTLRAVAAAVTDVRPFVLGHEASYPARVAGLSARERQIDRSFADAMLPGRDTLVRPRPRRHAGRDDLFYARLAAGYVMLNRRGSKKPTADLGAMQHPPQTPAKMRDWLHEARVRGLLSHSAAGQRGGYLTPLAKQILRRTK